MPEVPGGRRWVSLPAPTTALYGLYRQLHDAFGTQQWSGHLSHVMKELLNLRDEVRPA